MNRADKKMFHTNGKQRALSYMYRPYTVPTVYVKLSFMNRRTMPPSVI